MTAIQLMICSASPSVPTSRYRGKKDINRPLSVPPIYQAGRLPQGEGFLQLSYLIYGLLLDF